MEEICHRLETEINNYGCLSNEPKPNNSMTNITTTTATTTTITRFPAIRITRSHYCDDNNLGKKNRNFAYVTFTKIKRMLRENKASIRFIRASETLYETLLKSYRMHFERIFYVFEIFVDIHNKFLETEWEKESRNTMKKDPHFMRVWSRLLEQSKPLLKTNCVINVVITCLYLTYSLHGVETSYYIRPFRKYVVRNAYDVVRKKRSKIIIGLALDVINNYFSMDILR